MEIKDFVELTEDFWCYESDKPSILLHGHAKNNNGFKIVVDIDAYVQKRTETDYYWRTIRGYAFGFEPNLETAKQKVQEELAKEKENDGREL